MKKITLLFAILMASAMTFAATDWFNDFLTIKVDGIETANNYYIGGVPSPTGATALQGKAFGTVASLEITACDMKYWADGGDNRTGGAFYYKITNTANNVDLVAPIEVIWDHAAIGGNDYQGTKTTSINLLAGLPYGTYQLHVWAKSWGDVGGDSWLSNSGANYVATFTKAPAVASMSGTYKVGQNLAADFISLSAAVTALNTNGVGGNVVLEITSDITEPANIGLGVNTNGFGISIRPDADVDRTITFTRLADNSSPTGHFVIGYTSAGLLLGWDVANTIATNNVTIDGYAVGGTTKRLTFTNTNASHTGARVIVVVGACQNTVVKNCIINNLTTSTTSPFCIGAVVRKVGTAAGDAELAPNGLTIENNTLTALGNVVAMGVRITNSNTPLTAKLTGLVFKNNIVTARRRLFEINYTTGGEISGNQFTSLATGAAGTVSYGLWTSTGVDGTLKIHNNKFLKSLTEETGAFGHRVVSLASAATYEIYNNTFSGMDKTKVATAAALNITYLFYSGVAGKIYNNTFYMPALTDASSTGYYNCINLSGNTAEIRNNIFVSDEGTHANNTFISAVPTPATDNNIYFHRKPAYAGARFVSTFTTLAAYQAANPTKDVNSKSVDVIFANAAAGDLSIAGASIGDINLRVPRLSTVLTDLFGVSRNAYTYTGAHEAGNLNPKQTFTVTVPNGTEKVFVAGSFLDKVWDETNPLELTATANSNEFSGSFDSEAGVEYKYLCEKGDWDFQEAIYDGANDPLIGVNRTYNAVDTVPIWYRVNKITLNTTFATGVPNTLFVKGSFNGWASGLEMTKSGSTYSLILGGAPGNKYPANTEYKYYTNDMTFDNWEVNSDGSGKSNRWAIAPVMNDEIARFTTPIPGTGFENQEMTVRILRTNAGIRAEFDNNANIELYTINGVLIEKTNATGSYSRDLNNGIYIIRINGKSTKFIK